MLKACLLGFSVLLFFPRSVQSLACHFCASEYLEANWYVTGFPIVPAGLTYATDCFGSSNTEKKTCDTSACFEMMFPAGGAMQIVKGCHADFFPSSSKAAVATSTTKKCEMVDVFSLTNSDKMKYAAINFCSDAESCNKDLSADIDPTNLNKLGCVEPTIDCISCTKFDGKGKCTNSNDQKKQSIVKGHFCKKLDGQFGGHSYVERGAAIVAPYIDDICFEDSLFNMTLESGTSNGPLIRSKRSVVQAFKGSTCYCKTNMCNSGDEMKPMLLPMISVILGFLSVIPLF